MRKSLIAVGYWITSLNDDSRFPPQEFVRRRLGAEVASYLRSGENTSSIAVSRGAGSNAEFPIVRWARGI